ncbi:ABC transporter permease subunit [Risungbinella massiliensis]|uniref:ABC transporter permease subunit n=1 Tax=Risungbinella massiliensis TaxID=1329796 RepID=UPI0005CBE05A|nr:ABC transporter permease subunit [Risungbinella massiliensis]
MRDLGMVFRVEWMKLLARKRIWVTVGLALVFAAGLILITGAGSDISIHDDKKILEDMKLQVTQIEQQLAKTTDPTERSSLESEMKNMNESIIMMDKQLKDSQDMQTGDWRRVITERLNEAKNIPEELREDMQGQPSIIQKREEALREQEVLKMQYLLDQDQRPLDPMYAWSSSYVMLSEISPLIVLAVLPLLVVLLVADFISGETTSGTIKLLLVRPISRWKIFIGKWLVSFVATLLLSIGFIVTTILGVLAVNGTAGANEPTFVNVPQTYETIPANELKNIPREERQGDQILIPDYTKADIIPMSEYVWTTYGLSCLTMLVVASFTMLCSSFFKSSMVSTAVALVVNIFSFVVIFIFANPMFGQAVGTGNKYFAWLYSYHLNIGKYWSHYITNGTVFELSFFTGSLILVFWLVGSLLLGGYYFHRKDILNA